MTYYIYQMKSTACQHKCYIGVTNSPRKRLKSHLRVATEKWKKLTNFGRAVKRYGPETFTMRILDQTEDIKEAILLETKWIERMGHKKTWNHATKGGSYTANKNRRKPFIRKVNETRRKD